MTPAEYIISRSIPVPESGCWLWEKATLRGGYGICCYPGIKGKGRTQTAHRFSYKTFKGEIPKGMNVAHKCDVRSCVNPDHLWLATPKQNSEDMVAKKRVAYGERASGAKLKEEEVEIIRILNLPHRVIGEMYGVSHPAIGSIKRGETWRER